MTRTLRVPTLDYSRAPFLAIWEVTRACDLVCVHCRACAQPLRDPEELSLEEAGRLFRQIREMGTRLLVLTGGDPIKRPDVFDLIHEARSAGLDPSLSPSVTPLLTAEALRRGREAGLGAVSLSLDGASAAGHDAFRGVPGAFERTVLAAKDVAACGLELRVNTTVTSRNVEELPAVARLAGAMQAKVWSVFFLVPTGRAEASLQIAPERCEEVLRWLFDLSSSVPFRIKTTEAPHYRRVVLQEMARRSGRSVEEVASETRSGGGRFMPGINDARGFVFISHRGDVYPSGFFPLPAGNVRETSLAVLYRDSLLFRDLRNPERLHGRCGACPYRDLCGGSRARAFAATGDPLGEDPLCAFVPEAAHV